MPTYQAVGVERVAGKTFFGEGKRQTDALHITKGHNQSQRKKQKTRHYEKRP
jgi:hypothetical protein